MQTMDWGFLGNLGIAGAAIAMSLTMLKALTESYAVVRELTKEVAELRGVMEQWRRDDERIGKRNR